MSTTVQDWLDRYRAAWEDRDPDAAAALFTDDALYREQPYGEPFRGAEGVRAYWAEVTATQADVVVRYGSPIVAGDRAAVEWWVTMTNGGAPVALAGEFFLVFAPDGRVQELREYWHFTEGNPQPPAGWGV